MKSQNPIETMDVYASTSQYIDGPTTEQQAAGTVPLDTLPADWWNWLWKEMTTRINQASNGMESVYQEVLSVLQAADITPSDTSNTQLLTSINALITKPGTSSTAGTVKSSSASGKVSIDTNGIMTPNGMGVPSSLSTTAKTIVSAINEIFTALSTYKSTNDAAVAGKAPTNHASTATTYGKGDSTNYGHVKLSDSTGSTSGVTGGIAATPAAVSSVAKDLSNYKSTNDAAVKGKPSLGSSAGASDTSEGSSGSSSTAARSDHTHPYPGLVYNDSTKSKVTFTLSGNTLNITTTSV